jgi:Zinc carboxypeptidase
MKNFILIVSLFVSHLTFGQHTPFEGNTTPTWQECISLFNTIDEKSKIAKMVEIGTTDIGKPLHVLIINKDKEFRPEKFNRNKSILLINNAIHPGEPDGVDASLIFAEEITNPKNSLYPLLDSVIICIIPIYNVDGSMIRNGFSRTNQEGPEQYGLEEMLKTLI